MMEITKLISTLGNWVAFSFFLMKNGKIGLVYEWLERRDWKKVPSDFGPGFIDGATGKYNKTENAIVEQILREAAAERMQ